MATLGITTRLNSASNTPQLCEEWTTPESDSIFEKFNSCSPSSTHRKAAIHKELRLFFVGWSVVVAADAWADSEYRTNRLVAPVGLQHRAMLANDSAGMCR